MPLLLLLLACTSTTTPEPAATDTGAEDCDPTTPGAQLAPLWYADQDGDGWGDLHAWYQGCASPDPQRWIAQPGDCDDAHPGRHPGATEVCDAADTDEDCDGYADDLDDAPTGLTSWYADADGDGYGHAGSPPAARCDPREGEVGAQDDCDDTRPDIHPGLAELPVDGVDQDCDGQDACWADDDGDGFGSTRPRPGPATPAAPCMSFGVANNTLDCDDRSPTATPYAGEVCDGVDNDCDALIDDNDPDVDPSTVWYRDQDGDGFGGPGSTVRRCTQPAGYAANPLDCDDLSPSTYPAGTEVCDPLDVDEDCDGLADDQDPSVAPVTRRAWYPDVDGDRYGDDNAALQRCDAPAGFVTTRGDCDDGRPDVYPFATERPADDVDQDCDGLELCYCNRDGDLTGTGELIPAPYNPNLDVCAPPAAPPVAVAADCATPGAPRAAIPGDCDDGNAAVGPTQTLWAWDGDRDGFGDARITVIACQAPGGSWVTNTLDCDDSEATIRPSAPEVCDQIDNDCDAQTDEGIAVATWWLDDDGDGYGAPSSPLQSCASRVTGYVRPGAPDCDDDAALRFPGAPERCDALDDDCDGRVDETADCGPGAQRVEDPTTGGTWLLLPDAPDWSAAVAACADVGYRLAWFESLDEELTVSAAIAPLDRLWLGYRYTTGWRRVDGRSGALVEYTPSSPHELAMLPAAVPGDGLLWVGGVWQAASADASAPHALCEAEL